MFEALLQFPLEDKSGTQVDVHLGVVRLQAQGLPEMKDPDKNTMMQDKILPLLGAKLNKMTYDICYRIKIITYI